MVRSSLVKRTVVLAILALALLLIPGLAGRHSVAKPAPTVTATCVLGLVPPFVMEENDPETFWASLASDFRRTRDAVFQRPDAPTLSLLRRQKDPLAYLQAAVRADFDTERGLITISVSGEDPDELVVLLKAVMDSYLKRLEHRWSLDGCKRWIRGSEDSLERDIANNERWEKSLASKYDSFYPDYDQPDPEKLPLQLQDTTWLMMEQEKTLHRHKIIVDLRMRFVSLPRFPEWNDRVLSAQQRWLRDVGSGKGASSTGQRLQFLNHLLRFTQEKQQYIPIRKENLARLKAILVRLENGAPPVRIVQEPRIR